MQELRETRKQKQMKETKQQIEAALWNVLMIDDDDDDDDAS